MTIDLFDIFLFECLGFCFVLLGFCIGLECDIKKGHKDD